jgi:hypothetical protein
MQTSQTRVTVIVELEALALPVHMRKKIACHIILLAYAGTYNDLEVIMNILTFTTTVRTTTTSAA